MSRESAAGRRRSDVMPKISIDKKSKYARIYVGGKHHALGKAEGGQISQEQQREAARIWYEFLAGTPQPAAPADDVDKGPTVAEMCIAYLDFADKHFRYRDGRYTTRTHSSSYDKAKRCCALLEPWFDLPTALLESHHLEEMMAALIVQQLKRKTINKYKKDIITMLAWAVPKKLVPASVVDELKYVRGLQAGRTAAPESEGVETVSDDVVAKTLEHCHPIVQTIVKFQRHTGCRPTEACILIGNRIDKSADVWIFEPEYWKTQLTAKKKDRRMIPIDEELQEIIAPYLERPDDQYCFSPREACPAQAYRSGPHYLQSSYRSHIHRACDKAGIQRWCPNQLRHARSTEIKAAGLSSEDESLLIGHGEEVAKDYDHSKADRIKELARQELARRRAS